MQHLGAIELSADQEKCLDGYDPMGTQETARLLRQVEKMEKYVDDKHTEEQKRIAEEEKPGTSTEVSTARSPMFHFLIKQKAEVVDQVYDLIKSNELEGMKIPDHVKKKPKSRKDQVPILVEAGRGYLNFLGLIGGDRVEDIEDEKYAIQKLQNMCKRSSKAKLGKHVSLADVKYDKDTREADKKEMPTSLKNALSKAGSDKQKSIDDICTLQWSGDSFPRDVNDIIEEEEKEEEEE
jgi:hypothetical protein